MTHYPAYRAAAVQAAPEYLDTPATIEKACRLIDEAAGNGAELIAFPEVFVSAYPYWNWTMTPVQGGPWFERLYRSAIDVPGPEVATLGAAAQAAGSTVVIGVNERDPHSMGTVYNTMLFIGPDGELLGAHRKLVPTWAEKLSWGCGDGSSLRVYDTPAGRLGGLACGENTNTLARFALLAQGEQVHVASYIALPVAPADYDMVEAIKTRAAAHSFEGKVFTVVACAALTPTIVETVAHDTGARELLQRPHSAFSGIFGPDGRLIGDGLIDEEGIVYADIDVSQEIQAKQMHDIIGHYNRFDVFSLTVHRDPKPAVTLTENDTPAGPPEPPAGITDHDVA
ncbi:carbon-nitrogen hydrolase family protein [Leekyejoonella antrihumi]|uniref:Carbon-nitrogen hydrolase family protein n=1 Tax=Leekyejoonella antrihumi TaxID=1660198 RepID=A0A563DTE8_9MICO|nr:carbon-nitrogen hydrolase family protein [Leekyejoonella antrihumi]TWP32964.1 carbon-nitrogen hydrolase family protein [Leekyejoonella antrihumi]